MDISHMASGRHIETHFGVFVLDYVTSDGQSPGFGSVLSVKRLDFKHFTVLKCSANPVIAQYWMWLSDLDSSSRSLHMLMAWRRVCRRTVTAADRMFGSFAPIRSLSFSISSSVGLRIRQRERRAAYEGSLACLICCVRMTTPFNDLQRR